MRILPSPGMSSLVSLVNVLSVLLMDCFAESPPVFIKKPVDQIGVSGGVASFVCQATGDPKPRVTWNKKGKKVNSQRFETIEFDESAGAVLRIQPLRTPRDENIYECVAQNPHGEVTVHAKLTVLREVMLSRERGLLHSLEMDGSCHLQNLLPWHTLESGNLSPAAANCTRGSGVAVQPVACAAVIPDIPVGTFLHQHCSISSTPVS